MSVSHYISKNSACVAMTLLALSCSEPLAVDSTSNQIRLDGALRQSPTVDVVREKAPIRVFDLSIEIDSSTELGKAFRVSGTVRSLRDGTEVQLSLFAPDLPRGTQAPVSLRPRSSANADAEVTRALSRHQFAEVSRSFVVSNPGLYRFVAVARITRSHRARRVGTEEILHTQDVVVKEAWVFFASSGEGSLLSAQDLATSISGGQSRPAWPSSRGLSNATVGPVAHSTCSGYSGVAYYLNYDTPGNVTTPAIARALVAGFYVPISGSAQSIPYMTFTDDAGGFHIPSVANMYFSGHVQLENSRLKVGLDGYGVPHQTAFTLSQTCSGSGYHFIAVSANGKAWDIAELSSRRATAQFGRSRPALVYNVVSGDGGAYFPHVDRAQSGIEDIWGEYGTFIIAHEYGHAYQHVALGGGAIGGCAGDHYVTGAYNLKCAYSEGFADFFAAITVDDRLVEPDGWETAIENANAGPFAQEIGLPAGYWCLNKSAPGPCASSQLVTDGGLAEFAVAGLFYDLVDSPSTQNFSPGSDDDGSSYPWSWIGDVIFSCQVQENGQWRRADGIDHVIYCMEGSIGTYHADGYFPTRSVAPGAWSASATQPIDWSQRYFRGLWKGMLFVHGPPTPSSPPPSYSATIHGFSIVAPAATCSWTVSSNVPGGVSYAWSLNGQPVGSNSSELSLVTPSSSFQLSVVVSNAQLQGASTNLQVTVNAGSGACLDI